MGVKRWLRVGLALAQSYERLAPAHAGPSVLGLFQACGRQQSKLTSRCLLFPLKPYPSPAEPRRPRPRLAEPCRAPSGAWWGMARWRGVAGHGWAWWVATFYWEATTCAWGFCFNLILVEIGTCWDPCRYLILGCWSIGVLMHSDLMGIGAFRGKKLKDLT